MREVCGFCYFIMDKVGNFTYIGVYKCFWVNYLPEMKRIFVSETVMDCIQFSALVSIICLTESTKKYKI